MSASACKRCMPGWTLLSGQVQRVGRGSGDENIRQDGDEWRPAGAAGYRGEHPASVAPSQHRRDCARARDADTTLSGLRAQRGTQPKFIDIDILQPKAGFLQ